MCDLQTTNHQEKSPCDKRNNCRIFLLYIINKHQCNIFTMYIFTARKRSLGQGNIFASVCQEFFSQGRSAPLHAVIPPFPLARQMPPGKETPPGKADPSSKERPLTRRPPARQTPKQGDSPGKETPLARSPPGKADPLARRPPSSKADPPPPVQCLLGDTVNKQAVCILPECNLVFNNVFTVTGKNNTHFFPNYQSLFFKLT